MTLLGASPECYHLNIHSTVGYTFMTLLRCFTRFPAPSSPATRFELVKEEVDFALKRQDFGELALMDLVVADAPP